MISLLRAGEPHYSLIDLGNLERDPSNKHNRGKMLFKMLFVIVQENVMSWENIINGRVTLVINLSL